MPPRSRPDGAAGRSSQLLERLDGAAARSSQLLDDVQLRVELNTVGLRAAQRRRQAAAAARVSRGANTHIPETARVGLRAAALFETMDSVEEVADFLREMDMRQHIATFRAHAVTGATLMSLNGYELRETLGVAKLRDRRAIMDAIFYLHEQLDPLRNYSLPEDGRILTHLSNEVTFLAWMRFVVILLTVSVATVRLTDLGSGSNKVSVAATGVVVCLTAVAVVAYSFYRYFWMHRMIESPGLDFSPGDLRLLTPGLLLPTFAIILAYALMANDTEEAALLLLLSA